MAPFNSLLVLLFLCIATCLDGDAQDVYMRNPLPVAPTLAGNYGELRPNHFHAGLDLKTGGREGLEVMSVDDGHVSRIKISPYGYGKALYIDHANGTTTVYGHLQGFSLEITRYVKEYQQKQKSFEVDIYPGASELPVKAGQVVAISGNTGGSGGPHLHFEVRETRTEVPRNPLVMGFHIEDTKAPIIDAIGIAPIDFGSTVERNTKTFRTRVVGNSVNASQPIDVQGSFGIELNAYDSQNGSYNHNGIYQAELNVDGVSVALFTADSIPFSKSRHLNSLIDYGYYYQKRQRFIRLYREPGNQLPNLQYENAGRLDLPTGLHTIEVIARDLAGNANRVLFEVNVLDKSNDQRPEEAAMLEWNVPYFYESENCKLFLPAHTVYSSIPLDIEQNTLGDIPIVHIFDPLIPVQEAFELKIKVPEAMRVPGALIAQTNNAGRPSRALMSSVDGEWIRAESRDFGSFTLVVDDRPPSISMVNFSSSRIWESGLIKFIVKDNFSGVHTYNAYLGGQWVLMEYEPKQDLLFIDVNDLPRSETPQLLKLEISDMAGNVATFEGTLMHP